MSTINIGSVWRRISGHRGSSDDIGKTIVVEDVTASKVAYHYSNGKDDCSLRVCDFLEAFEEVGGPAELPTQQSWDYAEADRLLATAKEAIRAYNAYVDAKPATFYSKLLDV